MRFGAAVVVAILVGAFAAHFLLADRGYVLVNFRGFLIEMSVPGLVIVLLAIYLLVRALVGVAEAPRRWRAGRAQRHGQRAGSDLSAGIVHVVEGNWARGERLLTQGLKHADAPVANYLLAARAAQLQGALDRRDQWLELARGVSAEAATSVLLMRAELELEAGQPASAVATLEELEREKGEQPAALALLARAAKALGASEKLLALLPRLARAALPPAEREALAQWALTSELGRSDLTAERLDGFWGTVSADLRALPLVLAAHSRALERFGRGKEAEQELRAALKREWHPALAQTYGEVRGADLGKQLKQAETWLKAHGEDSALLGAAARLCLASELWGKARTYLEASLALAPAAETYALYGQLLLSLGETEPALAAFRSGLALAAPVAAPPWPAGSEPATPMLEPELTALR